MKKAAMRQNTARKDKIRQKKAARFSQKHGLQRQRKIFSFHRLGRLIFDRRRDAKQPFGDMQLYNITKQWLCQHHSVLFVIIYT